MVKNNFHLNEDKPLALIVGLANPGPEYAKTRHNAGAWLIEAIAKRFGIELRPESKFQGKLALIRAEKYSCQLFIPTHYMNQNGLSVAAIARFYNIPPESILVSHDELDFAPGVARLKQGGGHGGHNGLRSVIQNLKSNDFLRVRIGIGHPGDRNEVHQYVLKAPSQSDYLRIMHAIDQVDHLLETIISGRIQDAMKELHSSP